MNQELFIIICALIVITSFYYSLRSKARFHNETVAMLIFYRWIVAFVYVTFIYYSLLVKHWFSILYVVISLVILSVLWFIDHIIHKKEKNNLK